MAVLRGAVVPLVDVLLHILPGEVDVVVHSSNVEGMSGWYVCLGCQNHMNNMHSNSQTSS